MRTVYTTLPIYDSLSKQDYNRTGQSRGVLCPRHQLPPFQFETGNDLASIDEVLLVDASGNELDITSYFENLPELVSLTNDYIQYKGEALKTLLPIGAYYLQMTSDNDEIFYSEWICVEDIYPNLISTLANGGTGYDTYIVSGTTIASAITDGSDQAFSGSGQSFPVIKGELITVIVPMTLNSGIAPSVKLRKNGFTDISISNNELLPDGLNIITLIVTETSESAYLAIKNENTNASNYSTGEIIVIRQYSEDYIKLKFTNTKDLPTPLNEPTILYQDSFFDQVWFKTQLNTPEHEVTNVMTEKDGERIVEKMIAVYRNKIIDYIGRNLYRSLHRLPLHDDVVITDTVGNQYDVGHNIVVDPIVWDYYDMGTLTIKFNDGGTVWEGNAANMT